MNSSKLSLLVQAWRDRSSITNGGQKIAYAQAADELAAALAQQAQPLLREEIVKMREHVLRTHVYRDAACGAAYARACDDILERMDQQAQPEMPTREQAGQVLFMVDARDGMWPETWFDLNAEVREIYLTRADAVLALFAPKPDDVAEDRAYFEATGGVPFDHWGKGCPNDCPIPEHQNHKA